MTSAFASSANDSQILVKMIEFGLSAAVPFESFVIRVTAVPAVLSLPGKPTWWLPTGWTKRCTS
jgi:RND superfamily putative drug exporter